jgi:hypothetical protein
MSEAAQDAGAAQAAIEKFLASCRQPALLEPGEEVLPLTGGNFSLEIRGNALTLQVWDRTRNLSRRITAVAAPASGRLELTVQRFARRTGQMFLMDLARRSGVELSKKSGRMVFRERLRLLIRRQFPEWELAELSTEANLQHSLSPAFPRAWVRYSQRAWAILACPPEGDASAAISFGLIWLDYLRRRERRVVIEGVAFYVPAGQERNPALRVLCLDPAAARFELFTYTERDDVSRIDPRDHGNLDTRVEHCRRPEPNYGDVWQHIVSLEGVETVPKYDGRVSLRVRGLEFAEWSAGELRFGLREKRAARSHHTAEIGQLVAGLRGARSPESDHEHPLFRQAPESWLESQARAQLRELDASLQAEPVYGQVPAFAGGDRGVLDLLAVDHSGRLAVIELKASADIHLPLQALDYWIRVKWHLERGDFAAFGYFPGVELRREAPRLLLVSPSLEFHSTTETILGCISQSIEVERIGVSVEWRRGLRVMFRLRGAERPR